VGDQHAGTRERVHQRRLPGVGVAHERREVEPFAATRPTASLALPPHFVEACLQVQQASFNHAPVGLEERLTRTTCTDAATQTRQTLPNAAQPWPQILELRELDLHT